MIKTILSAAAAAVLVSAVPAAAQQTTAPGQQMQKKGSVKGTTGASGYAPGHADDKSGTRTKR